MTEGKIFARQNRFQERGVYAASAFASNKAQNFSETPSPIALQRDKSRAPCHGIKSQAFHVAFDDYRKRPY
jgi:hypothetical protein